MCNIDQEVTMDVKLKETTKHERTAPRWIYPPHGGRPYRSTTLASYNSKPRLYFSVEGETMLENFAYRETRPQKLYRSMLPEVFEALGLPPETKATWSKHAGCSMCPCSPGFILTIPESARVHRVDFWATLTGEAAKVSEITDRVLYRAQRGVEVLVEGRL